MADDETDEIETNQSTLALDSNKQKEFEDKVKRLNAEVSLLSIIIKLWPGPIIASIV